MDEIKIELIKLNWIELLDSNIIFNGVSFCKGKLLHYCIFAYLRTSKVTNTSTPYIATVYISFLNVNDFDDVKSICLKDNMYNKLYTV